MAAKTRNKGSTNYRKDNPGAVPPENTSGSSAQAAPSKRKGIGLPVVVLVLTLSGSCRPPTALAPSQGAQETRLAPMFVADLAADVVVDDFVQARNRLEFVQGLGGRITDVSMDDLTGAERMTVELRVPHKYAGLVADILRTELGDVTNIYAFSADVSVRNARLRHELATLEATVDRRFGDDLEEAKDRIELLHDMIAFQLERESYLFVKVRLVEAR